MYNKNMWNIAEILILIWYLKYWWINVNFFIFGKIYIKSKNIYYKRLYMMSKYIKYF